MAVDGRKLRDTLRLGSDVIHEHPCSPCAKDNRNVEAIKYCVDCEENICGKCESDHKRFAGMRGHQIEDKPRSQTGQKRPNLPTQKCDKHGGKLIDLYCSVHDVVGCSTCVAIEHSTCKEKFYIPDYIKNKPQAIDDRDIAAQSDKLAHNLAELQKNFVTEKEKLAKSKENTLKQIQRFRQDINHRLDELEKTSIKQLEKRFQSLIEKVEGGLREIRESTKAVESATKSLKSSEDNMSQAFVSIKIACDVASQTTDKVTSTKRIVIPSDVSFDANQKLQSLFSEVQNLGSVILTENVQFKPQSPDFSLQASKIQADRASSARQSSLPLLGTKGKKKVRVKVKSDKDKCSIRGACTLDDGTIILSDINNFKLKRLDGLSYNIIDFCDVPEWPLQVCAVSTKEVAVCCEMSKLVQFVSVGHRLQKTREIKTDIECLGLAHANGKLYVSDFTSVYLYTVRGERLKQFSENRSGQEKFSWINSLAISSDNTKIYVADARNGLIIMDRSGQIVGQYNGPEIKEAVGACWHKNCSVLVGGGLSKNVVQFGPDGKLIGEVLKTNTGCWAVCFSKDFSKLIVGMYRTDEIEVYDII